MLFLKIKIDAEKENDERQNPGTTWKEKVSTISASQLSAVFQAASLSTRHTHEPI